MTNNTSAVASNAAPVRELGLSPMVRLIGVVAMLAALLYAAACAIYNMPSSPVKVRIVGAATPLIRPYFEQDWQLFAPNPSTANGHIYVTARYQTSDGRTALTKPFDIQGPIEDLPKSNRVLPTKQPGITLAMQETFAAYRSRLLFINKGAAPSARAALHAQLDRQFAADFDKLRRLLSEQAAAHFPNLRITSVRGEFSQTQTTPFSERGNTRFPAKPSQHLLDTQWMPYATDVTRPSP